ncbi:XPG I-region family protein, partial [Trichomonas vaginalis G3]
AIDASLSIYQFLVSVRHTGQQLVDSEGNTTSHLQGVLSRTVRLIESGVKPVYVFDGKPPEMKGAELAKRLERREEAQKELEKAIESGDQEAIDKFSRRTVHLDKTQVEECKQLLECLGVPYVDAPCEAEAECAALNKAGLVDAMATEDMDSLAFATPQLIRHLSYGAKGDDLLQIDYKIMMEKSGLTREEFVDFCILMGCDYCDTIKGIGKKHAYELIKKYHNIETIIKNLDKKYELPEDFDYVRARELFFNHEVTTDVNLTWKKPDVEKVKEFLCGSRMFAESRVEAACAKIVKARGKGTQMRMDNFFKPAPSKPSGEDTKKKKPEKTPPKKKK